MMTLAQLRKKYRAASPAETLESLAALFEHPKLPDEYVPPLVTVVLHSGHSFRGYLLNCSGEQEKEKTFVFSLEIQNEGDGAADLCYVPASRIEAVMVWNVDDYPGTLPRFAKKP